MTTHAPITLAARRPGVDLAIGAGTAPVISARWTIGGWAIQFVRLDAHQRHDLDHSVGTVYVKVITGRLANIDRAAYAAAKVVRNTRVTLDHVEASAAGALFAVFTATAATTERITSMQQLSIGGPHAGVLRWQSFEDRYRAVIPYFNGLDCHLLPGFHLLDGNGAEIAYVFLWTAGKGVDLSTHDHGHAPNADNPAFAEVHWVMYNGTGTGGMYETTAAGALTRQRYPMQRGDEHGPFFRVDAATGGPRLRDNGAVDYPWHGWAAGNDDAPGQAYDVVAAFEITAPYAQTRA